MIRKSNVFGEDISEKEKELIEQRVSLQKKKFQEFERKEFEKKSIKIRAVYDFLHDSEIKKALKDNFYDESEVIAQFSEPGYLQKIRKSLAQVESNEHKGSLTFLTREQADAYDNLMEKRSKNSNKKSKNEGPSHIHTVGRLALDKALEQMKIDPNEAMKGWSLARINAYKNLKSNPNVYYYRFNAPGEEQRTGAWTKEERKLFFDRLKEVGANGQWGLFSMTIPGRVGYQCSNFYRLLVKNKEVNDPNYVVENGKVRYLFSTKQKDESGEVQKAFRSHSKHIVRNGNSDLNIKSKSRKKRGKKSNSSDNESTSDDEFIIDYKPKRTVFERTLNRSKIKTTSSNDGSNTNNEDDIMEDDDFDQQEDFDNPLPGFIDPITLDQVVQPAISPYGHVMGYANWVQCLTSEGSKNTCPLTKQHLTKRDLVILTLDNIHEYR
ncbi:hypothetical protein K502DRAFT_286516 [Neoconidiobolus thromboides FSU 785]|nr:hypothetical protein K502DRAFT_286516 [Neoconidiobolus thromboides FSU 785]